jgi:hypothetical protein
MPRIKDRVKQTTTSTGTGAVALSGTVSGFQTFAQAFTTGTQVYYCIADGTNWETGIGTYTAGSPGSLSRDTIMDSSSGGAAVSWGVGTKDVFVTLPATAIGEDTATSIAAASTVDIGSGTAKAIKITAGTGPITAWGTAPAGAHRDITFATAVVLAYNASTAILTGGGSITTMVGDTCRMESLGGGAWKMLSYQRANGMPLGAVTSQSLSSSDKSANATLADNNMSVSSTGGIASGRAATSITTPAYWEVVVNSIVTNSIPGIASAAAPVSDYLTNSAYGWGYLPSGLKGNSGQGQSFGASWANGDRLCFAYHPTSRGFWMGKVVGGVAVWGGGGDPVAGTNPAYTIPTSTAVFPCYSVVGTGSSLTFAFGSSQQVATPPSGFLAFT